jgi:2-haloalkanoic acid dehalogenase type II
MGAIRAVLFDFGGTLYDYSTLAPAEAESLKELAEAAGIPAEVPALRQAHREALRSVFRRYLARPYYRHRDLFGDAVREMARTFGVELSEELLERHFRRQWELHARDFRLRPRVPETLEELRRRGLHLGLVSNIDEDQLAHLGALAELDRRFDSILSSEAAGSCKPDPGIFELALERAGCAPQEALFVGDSLEQDIAGANRVGLRSVLLWHRDDLPVPNREPRPTLVIRRIEELLACLPPPAASTSGRSRTSPVRDLAEAGSPSQEGFANRIARS